MLFHGTRAALRADDGLRDESPLPWFLLTAGVAVPQKLRAAAEVTSTKKTLRENTWGTMSVSKCLSRFGHTH